MDSEDESVTSVPSGTTNAANAATRTSYIDEEGDDDIEELGEEEMRNEIEEEEEDEEEGEDEEEEEIIDDVEVEEEEVKEEAEDDESSDEESDGNRDPSDSAGNNNNGLPTDKQDIIKLQRERDLYKKERDCYLEELEKKVAANIELRKLKTDMEINLRSDNECTKIELQRAREDLAKLREVNQSKDEQIHNLTDRLNGVQDTLLQIENRYKAEVDSYKKLADDTSQSVIESEAKNERLLKNISEMQSLLQLAKQSNTDLEQVFKDSRAEFEDMMVSKNREIEQLVMKLQAVEHRVQISNRSRHLDKTENELQSIIPNASITGRTNTSLSMAQIMEIRSRFLEELDDVKSENERLKQQVRDMREDMEQNAPYLHQQSLEHDKSIETIEELQEKVLELITYRDNWSSERETLSKRVKFLERECSRFERENCDLSKQVQALLRAIEEERGTIIRDDRSLNSSGGLTSANSVIDAHLVTFKSIEELQLKNQQLLSAIRDLGALNDELESKSEQSDMTSLKERLDEAMSQIELLREERKNQTAALKNLIQQRDLFKMLLSRTKRVEHLTPEVFQQMVTVACSGNINLNESLNLSGNSSFISKTNTEDQEGLIKELRSSLEDLENEKMKLQEEMSQKLKSSSEDLKDISNELTQTKVEAARYSSQLEYTKERLQVVQTNSEVHRRECDTLRARTQKMTENLANLEKNLAIVTEERQSLLDKVNLLEIQNGRLTSEIELSEESYNRAVDEKYSLAQQNESQRQLLESLQSSIHTTRELRSGQVELLQAQINKSEQECAYFRNKLNDLEQNHHKKVEDLQNQVKELMMRLKMIANANLQNVQDTAKSTKAHMEQIQSQISLSLKPILDHFENQKATAAAQSVSAAAIAPLVSSATIAPLVSSATIAPLVSAAPSVSASSISSKPSSTVAPQMRNISQGTSVATVSPAVVVSTGPQQPMAHAAPAAQAPAAQAAAPSTSSMTSNKIILKKRKAEPTTGTIIIRKRIRSTEPITEEPKPGASKLEKPKHEDTRPEESKPEVSKPEEPRSDERMPQEPTPEEPIPQEPTPEEPMPQEPTPGEPMPKESKLEESQPEDSTPEEPKPEEPQPEEPKLEEPQPEEPKLEEPQPEESKLDEPKPEVPTLEDPKNEESMPEELKLKQPRSEDPDLEEPKLEKKKSEPQPEDPKPEEAMPEEPRHNNPDPDPDPEEPKPEEPQPEEPMLEEPMPKESSPQDPNPEESKLEEPMPEESKLDEPRHEDPNTEEQMPEELRP